MNNGKISIKIVVLIAIVLVLLAGIPIGVFLLRQTQELREQAAVPIGEARVSLSPATATHPVGEKFPVAISFTSNDIPISAIAIRVSYLFSGGTPEITASEIEISPQLLQSGEWSCPVKTITPVNNKVQIDLACVNLATSGFAAVGDTLLATFNLTGNQVPIQNPTVLSFDSQQSIITRKSDAQDVLLIPTSTGSYTIASVGGSTVPTLTPSITPTTGVGLSPTLSPPPTATLTPTPTTTISSSSGSTSSPTSTTTPPSIPETGISLPTILFIGLGIFLIAGSALLAF